MVEELLELDCGCAAVSLRQIGLPAQVGGSKTKPSQSVSEVVGNCRSKVVDSAGGVGALKGSSCTDVGEIDKAYECILGEITGEILGQSGRLARMGGQGQHNGANGFHVSAP